MLGDLPDPCGEVEGCVELASRCAVAAFVSSIELCDPDSLDGPWHFGGDLLEEVGAYRLEGAKHGSIVDIAAIAA